MQSPFSLYKLGVHIFQVTETSTSFVGIPLASYLGGQTRFLLTRCERREAVRLGQGTVDESK